MSKSMTGRKRDYKCDGAAKKVVAIHDGKVVARFSSAYKASLILGLNYTTIRKYIKGKVKPKNGWKWFYEKDGTWFDYLKD